MEAIVGEGLPLGAALVSLASLALVSYAARFAGKADPAEPSGTRRDSRRVRGDGR